GGGVCPGGESSLDMAGVAAIVRHPSMNSCTKSPGPRAAEVAGWCGGGPTTDGGVGEQRCAFVTEDEGDAYENQRTDAAAMDQCTGSDGLRSVADAAATARA